MSEWIRLATSRDIVVRASKYALGVGFILIAINHGDALLSGQVAAGRLIQMGLTVLVPYCVSTLSSVGAIQNIKRRQTETDNRSAGAAGKG
ncbi:MAG: nitrate/nitrite transporter NrtS [Acidobacteria bacterium]|nr:nitrate/nitrite transporter NrtS [Acidobacteriota bacterium]